MVARKRRERKMAKLGGGSQKEERGWGRGGFREERYPCWTHAMTMPSAEAPWVGDTSHPNPNTVIGATRRQVPFLGRWRVENRAAGSVAAALSFWVQREVVAVVSLGRAREWSQPWLEEQTQWIFLSFVWVTAKTQPTHGPKYSLYDCSQFAKLSWHLC